MVPKPTDAVRLSHACVGSLANCAFTKSSSSLIMANSSRAWAAWRRVSWRSGSMVGEVAHVAWAAVGVIPISSASGLKIPIIERQPDRSLSITTSGLPALGKRSHVPMMPPDLTDEETAALVGLLWQTTDNDRHPWSPRIQVLTLVVE